MSDQVTGLFEGSSSSVFAFLVAGAAFKVGAFLWLRKKKDERFRAVGLVTEINVFPAKSCKGITTRSARATKTGVQHKGVFDRSFLIIGPNEMYITQRQEPTMALIEPSIHGDMLHFDAPGMVTLEVSKDSHAQHNNLAKFQVKLDIFKAVDCGPEAAAWFSKFLKRPGCKLLYYAPELPRRDLTVVKKKWDTKAQAGDQSLFSDFGPYLLASEESLAAINDRLTDPVTMRRFRANIIMRGSPAFEEENWTDFRIGEARFRGLHICTRCGMTTVDPEKGVKDEHKEPLTTMKRIHSSEYYKGKALFGLYAALDQSGDIQVGDTVYALQG